MSVPTVGDKAADSWEICGLGFYENAAAPGRCFNLVCMLKLGVGGLDCCRKLLLKAISMRAICHLLFLLPRVLSVSHRNAYRHFCAFVSPA